MSDDLSSAGGPPDTPIEDMSFEQALLALEAVVKSLEAGNLGLEEAINAYEYGSRLKQYCERKLNEAQLRVDNISLGDKQASDTDKGDTDKPDDN